MIKSKTAFSYEVDYAEVAISEILEQLDLDNFLLNNSIGIIACLPAYIESGIVEKLADTLPFDLIGSTTIAASVKDSLDQSVLSLMVLTSNDISFETILSDRIEKSDKNLINSNLKNFIASRPIEQKYPSIALTFSPLLFNVAGDFILESIEDILEGVPCFGMSSVDDTDDYHKAAVIYKGKSYPDQLAMLLLYGDVKSSFFLATLSHEHIYSESGVVSSSQDNQLKEVDGAPVSAFLEKMGLDKDAEGNFFALNSFPYIVDYNDGSDPFIRAMFGITPEGYAIVGGRIKENATLSVGHFNDEDILRSAEETIKLIDYYDDIGAILVFSCIGRYLHLGFEPERGTNILHRELDNKNISYLMAYAGGEFSPVSSPKNDTLVNRYHNCTLVACVLR